MKRIGEWLGFAGLLLILGAAGLYVARPQWELAKNILLILGAISLLAAAYASFGSLRSFFAQRTTRYSVNVALMIILLLGIIVFVEAVSFRHSYRVDLTENKRYSLSSQTIKLLQSLKSPISATAFYRTDQPAKRVAEDLFKQYASYSKGKLTWQIVDPDRNPGLAKRYGVDSYGTVVLESGKKEEKVSDADEEKLTNGIVRVTRAGQRIIYVLKGHGERDIANSDKPGFSEAKSAMEKANYQVKDLLLIRDPKIPEDASILLIPGPKNDLFPPELAAIDGFIAKGGKALFMVDPFEAKGLTSYLEKYGVAVRNNLIIELSPIGQLFGAGPEIPVVAEYENHPITRDLRGVATLFPLSRSLEAQPKPPQGVSVQLLAKTSSRSWGETSQEDLKRGEVKPDPQDQPGPLALLAVVTVPAKEAPEGRSDARARVVVFGTSNIATNQFLNIAGNRDLFLNTVSWLAEEEDLIAIRPKESRSNPVFLTPAQGRLVFFLPVVVLPAVIIIAGITAAVRRRRTS
jgi:ABC-type uncharacterized transport system involved in gliding motility auxiliary subunit